MHQHLVTSFSSVHRTNTSNNRHYLMLSILERYPSHQYESWRLSWIHEYFTVDSKRKPYIPHQLNGQYRPSIRSSLDLHGLARDSEYSLTNTQTSVSSFQYNFPDAVETNAVQSFSQVIHAKWTLTSPWWHSRPLTSSISGSLSFYLPSLVSSSFHHPSLHHQFNHVASQHSPDWATRQHQKASRDQSIMTLPILCWAVSPYYTASAPLAISKRWLQTT